METGTRSDYSGGLTIAGLVVIVTAGAYLRLMYIEKDDLVFFRSSWYSTPILYYMGSDGYRFVGRDYFDARNHSRRARIWILWFYNYEENISIEMRFAAQPYQCVQTIDVPGARGLLYSPRDLKP